MLYRTRWSSAASHAEALADAVDQLLVGALGKGGSGRMSGPPRGLSPCRCGPRTRPRTSPRSHPLRRYAGTGRWGEQVPCQARCGVVGERLRATLRLAAGLSTTGSAPPIGPPPGAVSLTAGVDL